MRRNYFLLRFCSLVFSPLIVLSGGTLSRADTCACCANAYTHEEQDLSVADLSEGMRAWQLTGSFGVWIYGENDSVAVKPVETTGSAGASVFTFRVERNGRSGFITVTPVSTGRLSLRSIRFLLRPSDYSKLHGEGDETELSKEIVFDVRVLADSAAESILGYEIQGPARLTLFGNGNRCFNPEDMHQWDLSYRLKQRNADEDGRAYGHLALK